MADVITSCKDSSISNGKYCTLVSKLGNIKSGGASTPSPDFSAIENYLTNRFQNQDVFLAEREAAR